MLVGTTILRTPLTHPVKGRTQVANIDSCLLKGVLPIITLPATLLPLYIQETTDTRNLLRLVPSLVFDRKAVNCPMVLPSLILTTEWTKTVIPVLYGTFVAHSLQLLPPFNLSYRTRLNLPTLVSASRLTLHTPASIGRPWPLVRKLTIPRPQDISATTFLSALLHDIILLTLTINYRPGLFVRNPAKLCKLLCIPLNYGNARPL